jgi:tRNA(adenine34) deaminase
MSNIHFDFMALALAEAEKAKTKNEVPVGAILVKDNAIIATGFNQVISLNDPSAHAEIQVIRKAGQVLNNYRLTNTILYVTLEPCAMCFGAMIHARIKTVVFATPDPRTGCLGGCQNLNNQCSNHSLEIIKGVMAEQSSSMLKQFFKNKR